MVGVGESVVFQVDKVIHAVEFFLIAFNGDYDNFEVKILRDYGLIYGVGRKYPLRNFYGLVIRLVPALVTGPCRLMDNSPV